MSLDGQMERLCALYGEKSDDELQAMYQDREDLTEVAQAALAQTMQSRKLVGRVEAAADEVADGLPMEANEAALYTFSDAFEAREAIRVLNDAGVWQRVGSYDDEAADGGGRPMGLTLIVREADYAAAVAVLRVKLGLFPKAEGDGSESPLGEMQAMVMLSMFDRHDALVAAQALGGAGISYCWRDGQDESEALPDEGTVAIEVRGEQLVAATAVVEKALAERQD